MEYRKFGNVIVARIDKGEEILEQVKEIALKEQIKLASVQALGAISSFTAGVFKTDEKKYLSNEFEGAFEIVSLTGTINTMNGEFYCHLHISAGNEKGQVFGGHLNRAVVSATCDHMAIYSFASGVILSLSVPVLIPAIIALPF